MIRFAINTAIGLDRGGRIASAEHVVQGQDEADQACGSGRNDHSQAVLCLARRRIGVLWAMLRGQCPYLQASLRGGIGPSPGII